MNTVTGRKVAIADDDKFIRDLLVKTFSTMGFATYIAVNGEGLMKIVREKKPDIIITDIHMEHTGGAEIIDELHEHDIFTPVIAVTGDESLELERQIRSKGIYAYFVKPIEIEILKKTVLAALAVRGDENGHLQSLQ